MNKGIKTVVYPVKEIGRDRLTASVKDENNNIIGLIQ